jgi:hypothetical protein
VVWNDSPLAKGRVPRPRFGASDAASDREERTSRPNIEMCHQTGSGLPRPVDYPPQVGQHPALTARRERSISTTGLPESAATRASPRSTISLTPGASSDAGS